MTYTYIELIDRFWQQFENKGMKPNDALLYFFLLKECNCKSWQNPFQLPNKKVVIALDISEKSVIDSRRRLVERELIKVKKGDRNCSPPEYFIIGVEGKKFNLPTESRTVDEKSMNGRRTVTLYKVNNKYNIISPNGDIAVATPAENSLFADEEKKPARKSKSTRVPPPPPPTPEEVRQYFLQNDADKRLENWEASASLFFDTFNADGWVNKRGRSVAERTKWESEANKWIFYREEQEKKTKLHETQQADRFSERRGTEPGAKSRKGFKGTF